MSQAVLHVESVRADWIAPQALVTSDGPARRSWLGLLGGGLAFACLLIVTLAAAASDELLAATLAWF